MEAQFGQDAAKKVALEDLSRDELIRKCKGLLSIAQKAKQAKDQLLDENTELKKQLKSSNSTNNDASNEIIETLTQQKLQYVTEIESTKRQNHDLNSRLEKALGDLKEVQAKNDGLDNENICYKRQVERLTQENEDLLTNLDGLEREIGEFKQIGLQQQEQLLLLEKNNKRLEETQIESSNKEIGELQRMLSVSLAEIKKLQTENNSYEEKIDNLKLNLSEKDKNIVIISEELQIKNNQVLELQTTKLANVSTELQVSSLPNEGAELQGIIENKNKEIEELKAEFSKISESNLAKTKESVDKLRERVKFYHSKIVKFAGNVRELKENKSELLCVFRAYVDQVETWKNKLTSASNSLIEHLGRLQQEIEELQKENRELKEHNLKLESDKTDDEKSKELEAVEGVKNENKALKDEINELISRQGELQNEIGILKDDKEGLMVELNENKNRKEEVNSLLIIQEELRSQIEILIGEKEALGAELGSLVEKHQEELRLYADQNKQDSLEIQNKIEENEKICLEYRKVISKLEGDIDLNLRELEALKQKNFTSNEELEHLRANEIEFANKTSEEILKLVQENAQLLEANKKLTEPPPNQDSSIQTDAKTDRDLDEVAALKRENTEVLSEMNEMNQALKERGETISKLQAHCDEIMKKLQIYETQANKNIDNITEKEEIIKNLRLELDNANKKSSLSSNVGSNNNNNEDLLLAQIAQLKAEIEVVRSNNSTMDSSYAESETMSTSTISRSEEANRLKDLEGSWEERYGKLRTLALKLKAKIRDLTSDLNKTESEKAELHLKLANSVKTIGTLQGQSDNLEDQLDLSKKENKDLLAKLDQVAADISKDKQRLAEDQEVITILRKELDEMNKDKTNTETWKKQISNKVQTLRKELDANKVMKRDLETKIAKLTTDLEAKEIALKTESDCHQQTKNSLEVSNNERKKNSVLNLEMQDYERSVKDLSQKLEKRQEQITKLKSQIESQKTTSSALREQTKLLEQRANDSERDLESAKTETVALKKQLNDFEDVINQKENKIQTLTQLLENTRSENEELSTELSKVIAEHQKVNVNLRSDKEGLRSQNLGLQQSLREVQEALKLKQDELLAIQGDYENYKVRAQSVLRQNQSRDVGLEEKLSEEVTTLKARCEALNEELDECRSTIQKLKEESGKFAQEKDQVKVKYQELQVEVEDIKALYDQLVVKNQQTVIEHAEAVRSLKVHAETLAQCYRQQLSEQEVRHNREIIELQSKVEKAPSPAELQFPTAASLPALMMAREEGEGSESVESVTKPSLHPVPLERLLGADGDQEIVYMKKQLREEESKVIHLTALLADTEQDLAKHVQMNKLLKEEIRRQQRSVEREKHAENLEYLKNVVFKFVTLHSGDERSRLVPVLNTILKLSPEETQKLNMVARGDPGLRGWANYLPMWSPSKS